MSNNLREKREANGLPERELAEKAHTSKSTLSEFEMGVRKPWSKLAVRLSKLAMPTSVKHICCDAHPIDPESFERFCQVWAEVVSAILARRSRSNEQQRGQVG